MLDGLADLLPAGARRVVVDGPADRASLFAAQLTERLAARDCQVLVIGGRGRWCGTCRSSCEPRWRADGFYCVGRVGRSRARAGLRHWPASRRRAGNGTKQSRQQVARRRAPIARHRPGRRLLAGDQAGGRAAGGGRGGNYLTETRAFFACRAATWDVKFGDDIPAYRAAVGKAGISRGGVAIDVGCGTGRALAPLREAVGSAGAVIALDVTPEMLGAARPASAAAGAAVVLADARALPLRDGCADAIFAAGLVNHLPDTAAGLSELARVIRPGGKLVLFHPSGRAAPSPPRHGHAVSHDEPLAEGPLHRSTRAAGWLLTTYDDAPHRFFALAERR